MGENEEVCPFENILFCPGTDKYPKAAALQRLLSFPSNGIDFIQKPEKRNTPLFTEKILSPNQKNMCFLLNPEAQSYKIAIDF